VRPWRAAQELAAEFPLFAAAPFTDIVLAPGRALHSSTFQLNLSRF